uniref:Uncharacterized protein n=1 Tax=Bubo bubo TaxID=30461 RepID=A0A8C0IHR9_BUBBB
MAARPWAYCRQMKVQFIVANVQQLLQRMMDKCFWNYKGKPGSSLEAYSFREKRSRRYQMLKEECQNRTSITTEVQNFLLDCSTLRLKHFLS